MIKQIDFGDLSTVTIASNDANEAIRTKNTTGFDLGINAVFILIQVICSCLAGVYNEYLLKKKGEDINIYIQNVFMYLDSIICNAIILLLQGNILSAFKAENLTEIFRPSVIIIMINSCCVGIITSFFLKYLNSILKSFASALEIIFTAILCRLLFSIPIYINTILSIAIVSIAIYVYSQSPVVNLSKSVSSFRNFRRALFNFNTFFRLAHQNEILKIEKLCYRKKTKKIFCK